MRLNSNSPGIKIQIQELMVVCGALCHSVWESPGFGWMLVSLGVFGAIFRAGFELAEKNKIAEAKQVESEKIKSATSALADAFGGFGKASDGES